MTDHRAEFDATVAFSNGGSLRAEGFRVGVPGPHVTEDEVAALFVASLGLLMTEQVQLDNLRVFEEAHKGTRGGPSAAPAAGNEVWRHVELSHVIRAGMTTCPGLPTTEITPHLTRGVEGALRVGHGVRNRPDQHGGHTATYLDSPFHRYADGDDLSRLRLASLVDLPAVVVRTVGSTTRAVDVGALAAYDVGGCAVLLHTGGDAGWGTDDYARDAPYLTEAGARWLCEQGATLVGIDSVDIDDTTSGGERPAHSLLLGAGIPVVEHLTNLDQVPPNGARFTAAPPRLEGFGTFPVRAYAAVPA